MSADFRAWSDFFWPGTEVLRARAVYESAGFERWPVARYFKELS